MKKIHPFCHQQKLIDDAKSLALLPPQQDKPVQPLGHFN